MDFIKRTEEEEIREKHPKREGSGKMERKINR